MPAAPRFVWKDSYLVGSGPIDAQHRQLIDLANLLHAALKSGKGAVVEQQAFEALCQYTKQHFADEELHFVKAGLDTEEHRLEHWRLSSELASIQSTARLGLLDGVTQALERWIEERLVPHMVEVDQRTVRGAPRR